MPISLTPEGAATELRARGHDPRDVVALSGGLWSAAFAFVEDGRDYVVRFHERRDDLEKDRFAYRWTSSRVRTPRIVEIGDMPQGAYGISERVHGTELDAADEAGMRAVLPSLFDTLDALREADVTGTTGYGLWHGDGRGEHATWSEALMRSERTAPGGREQARDELARSGMRLDEYDAGIVGIRELLPFQSAERHVVHNDLLYHNVFVDSKGVILLDWGASIFGDFVYDWALLTFWWPWYRGRWGGIDIRAELSRHLEKSGGTIPRLAERLRACELDIGTSHIVFQASRGMLDEARWTAARTLAVLKAPLRVSWTDRG